MQSEQRLLTGNEDVDYQILDALEPLDLINICQVSTYSEKLCDNKQFWIKKFNVDQLPITTKSGSPIPTTLQQWLNLYLLMSQTKTDVRHIILIRDILKKNEIVVFGQQSVLYQMLNLSDQTEQGRIKIIIQSNEDYTLYIHKKAIHMNQYEMIQFLIKVRYMALLDEIADGYTNEYAITDVNKIPYLVHSQVIDYYEQLAGDDYYLNVEMLDNRLIMFKTILYLEKDSTLLDNHWGY